MIRIVISGNTKQRPYGKAFAGMLLDLVEKLDTLKEDDEKIPGLLIDDARGVLVASVLKGEK